MSAFCTKTHGTAELIKGEGGGVREVNKEKEEEGSKEEEFILLIEEINIG